ncbi:MAG: YfhO family protein [Elusimicrobia bacterium]|nr:YfhO family protein [Elusimicrobiota bacterium]
MKKNASIIIFSTVLTLIFLPKICLMTHLPITPGLGGSDITDLNFPYRHFLANSLKNYKVPVWSNLIWCGYPLHAEGQGGFCYPLNVMLFSVFPADISFNLSFILNFVLCTFFSFLFFAEIGLKKQTAVFSATIFSFSGFFFCHIQHLNMLNAVIWFPLIFYFIERYLKSGDYKNIAGAGISFGIQILAGFPQFAYYTLIFSFLYFFVEKVIPLSVLQSKTGGNVLYRVKGFLLFVLIGLGISAIQWLPTLELVNFTARKTGFAKDPARWWWAYDFSDLITWLVPFKYGLPFNNSFHKLHSIFIENSFYMSKIAFVTGVIGLFYRFKKNTFFAVTVILTFIIALSSSLGITAFLDSVPGFEQFRLHQRILIFTVFSLCLFFGYIFEKLKNNFLKILVFLLVVADLFYFANKQNAFYKKSDWMDAPPVVEFMKKDKSDYRVWNINSYNLAFNCVNGFSGELMPYLNYRNFLQPNSNIIWNIPAIEGHGGLRPKRFYEIWDEMMKRGISYETLRFIGLAGGKYIITTYSITSPYLDIKKEYEYYTSLPAIKIYENKLFMEKAFFVKDMVLSSEVIEQMFNKDFNPAQAVVLEETTRKYHYTGKGNVSVKKYLDGEVEIEVTSDNGGFLVLTDSFYPGWKAFIDGQETKIYKADYIFRAVEVPPDRHLIRFAYKPYYFIVGKWVSVFSLFCLIFYLFFAKIKNLWI